MISTQINILDYVQLSEEEVDIISLAAKNDAELKLQGILGDDFDIHDCDFSFEFFCNVNIKPKRIKL